MKILYFYPENPLHLTQGNNARAFSLLNYFKNRNIDVDFVGEKSVFFHYKDINNLIDDKLIKNGVLLSEYLRKEHPVSYFFYESLPEKIGLKIRDFDRLRYKQVSNFNKMLKENQYDYIIISYAYWAKLVINNPNIDRTKTKLIIDTHDFLTSQFNTNMKFKLGKYFEKEITTLQYFDYVMAISIEEKYLFSQFIDEEKVLLVSHGLKENFQSEALDYDVVYVASDNDHNLKGAKWFLDKVYPLLPKDIKIVIVGKINISIKNSYSNITQINFAPDVNQIYSKSKIAICPMFSGTGIKIKVLEALSFGIPVVCNSKGVDGLVNKTNNGCLVTNDVQTFSDYIIKLISDRNTYENTSQKAKLFFNEYYEEKVCYRELTTILE